MALALGRTVRRYGGMASMAPKFFLAYSIWVWMEWAVQTIALIITSFFWRAVYTDQTVIAGLAQSQTLTYVLLALIFAPFVHSTGMIYNFGYLLKEGQIAVELLRPLDFQAGQYVWRTAELWVGLILQVPLFIVALFLGMQPPLDPRLWAVFLVTAFLGHAVLFCFDWMLGCLAFYVTEIWGLSVARYGFTLFASGLLVPLALMPDWLAGILNVLPFAQALYVPLSFLTGIAPLSDAPRVWLAQLAALAVLLPLSRWVFRVAVRKVTVQGG
ncbi:MAG: ABC-2 family transporter protein [Anaerolineae bacterium]|nr:ABC-2 family transporter protein [Anaerolineae bacterium]